MPPNRSGIGTMQEGSLHASLKEWYSLPGDLLEATVEGYSVDIVRGGLLIEIQTRNFSALKRKLKALVENHRVRLVYPIPMEKWIARVSDGGELIGRRRSPRRGSLEGVFYELVSFPQLVRNPGFSLEVLMIREEEVRRMTSNRWRKAWSTVDRRLLEVVESAAFESPSDYRKFLPRSIRAPFTSRDLADALRLPCNLAQKMAYCLRGMGVIEAVGRRGNFLLYATSVSR